MSPARVDASIATTSRSTKRAPTSRDDRPDSKRRRTASSSSADTSPTLLKANTGASSIMTTDELAKKGIRRSIALVLDAIGFDSASEEAMESFTTVVETYLSSLIEDVSAFAGASRRSLPIPTDFETSLKRFNIVEPSLKPHLRPPVPKSKRDPTWHNLPLEDQGDRPLPVLSNELSGTPEKEARQYIPTSFPSFPSRHTYRYTPEDVESVTISDDWGVFDPDQASQPFTPSHTQSQTRPLASNEIPRGDPKKMREAAAKEAKSGEEALRRLMRASKIAKQKEVWSTAQREPSRRDRYDLWEAAMRELIEDDARVNGRDMAPGAVHGAMGRFEIADHSMIVNAEGRFRRKEVPRTGGRKLGTGDLGKS